MAKTSTNRTVVVFRVWPDGSVLALFPYMAATLQPYHCTAFEHIGQHGGADYTYCIRHTRAATRAEYAALKRELESPPYNYVLDVRTRATRRRKG